MIFFDNSSFILYIRIITYTTTVKGKVITPAKAAGPTKGSVIATAQVWASTDPAKKVDVGTDGSYTLEVAGHSGSFTITAEYTATSNKNYKTSDPKSVTTTAARKRRHICYIGAPASYRVFVQDIYAYCRKAVYQSLSSINC